MVALLAMLVIVPILAGWPAFVVVGVLTYVIGHLIRPRLPNRSVRVGVAIAPLATLFVTDNIPSPRHRRRHHQRTCDGWASAATALSAPSAPMNQRLIISGRPPARRWSRSHPRTCACRRRASSRGPLTP